MCLTNSGPTVWWMLKMNRNSRDSNPSGSGWTWTVCIFQHAELLRCASATSVAASEAPIVVQQTWPCMATVAIYFSSFCAWRITLQMGMKTPWKRYESPQMAISRGKWWSTFDKPAHFWVPFFSWTPDGHCGHLGSPVLTGYHQWPDFIHLSSPILP